jgi:streptomycin 6-kinase
MCADAPDRSAWIAALPATVADLQRRWQLVLETPFSGSGCAWVVPVICADGAAAVLKVAMPHMEGAHEIEGLRFWNGNPTVRLLASDDGAGAMLLERCEPGTALRTLTADDQDVVIAGLLRRLWRSPGPSHRFRQLSTMVEYWIDETLTQRARWTDEALVRHGLRVFREMATPTGTDVVLATDLHAGNVLRAQREPWLVIDPKPFVGDAAYDTTQHLLNCRDRLGADPLALIQRISELAGVNDTRVRGWLFARAAAEPRDDWDERWRLTLARTLATSL